MLGRFPGHQDGLVGGAAEGCPSADAEEPQAGSPRHPPWPRVSFLRGSCPLLFFLCCHVMFELVLVHFILAVRPFSCRRRKHQQHAATTWLERELSAAKAKATLSAAAGTGGPSAGVTRDATTPTAPEAPTAGSSPARAEVHQEPAPEVVVPPTGRLRPRRCLVRRPTHRAKTEAEGGDV